MDRWIMTKDITCLREAGTTPRCAIFAKATVSQLVFTLPTGKIFPIDIQALIVYNTKMGVNLHSRSWVILFHLNYV